MSHSFCTSLQAREFWVLLHQVIQQPQVTFWATEIAILLTQIAHCIICQNTFVCYEFEGYIEV